MQGHEEAEIDVVILSSVIDKYGVEADKILAKKLANKAAEYKDGKHISVRKRTLQKMLTFDK